LKQANIYIHNRLAGILTENDTGYSFCYDNEYLHSEGAEPVSLTMPLRKEEFISTVLFPFFDGLIPEGWLLDIAYRSWKIDLRDRMSLLMACCKDCIGTVSVIPTEKEMV
jgi:serine/threonine-protein kinase HipA